MKRNIDIELLKWKKTSQRKVLLIRGTRQIGKTYAIRKLGETFKHFIEINFEEELLTVAIRDPREINPEVN